MTATTQRASVANIAGHSAARAARVLKAWQAAEMEHGQDPATRDQAAAHEAAHAVMARALGNQVNVSAIEMVTERGRCIWTGATRYSSASGELPRAVTAASDPVAMLEFAMIAFAGITGEIRTGHAHPASAIDERLISADACAQIDAHMKRPIGSAMLLASLGVFMVLEENQIVFDAVRKLIANELSPSRRSLDRVLADVKPVDSRALLGRFP